MARLTAVITFTDKETKEEHKDVHAIGYFLENDNGEIVYSDGEVIDKDDLQRFIDEKVDEYNEVVSNYINIYFYSTVGSTDIEYGINDVTEKLGYLRDFK